MPVIPATQEVEAGEAHEPKRWRLQWAKITPLHSSMSNSETPSQKKKKSVLKSGTVAEVVSGVRDKPGQQVKPISTKNTKN